MQRLAGHQLGSSDLLFTLLEELGERQGLPEPGTSFMAVLSLLLEMAVYVLAELHRVEMWIFLVETFLRNVFVAGGRDLNSGLSRASLP